MCGNEESNGTAPSVQRAPPATPYQAVQDYISNVNSYKIIESTLREGEQFANSFFDTETKVKMYGLLPMFLYIIPRLRTNANMAVQCQGTRFIRRRLYRTHESLQLGAIVPGL